LSEPKAELMIGVVDLVGAEVINYSGSRYPELMLTDHDCPDNETLHMLAYITMIHLPRALFNVRKRVSLSGICQDNESPFMGLDIRTNTGMDLIFRLTRPIVFYSEITLILEKYVPPLLDSKPVCNLLSM
jgi:hypothetical protein